MGVSLLVGLGEIRRGIGVERLEHLGGDVILAVVVEDNGGAAEAFAGGVEDQGVFAGLCPGGDDGFDLGQDFSRAMRCFSSRLPRAVRSNCLICCSRSLMSISLPSAVFLRLSRSSAEMAWLLASSSAFL